MKLKQRNTGLRVECFHMLAPRIEAVQRAPVLRGDEAVFAIELRQTRSCAVDGVRGRNEQRSVFGSSNTVGALDQNLLRELAVGERRITAADHGHDDAVRRDAPDALVELVSDVHRTVRTDGDTAWPAQQGFGG